MKPNRRDFLALGVGALAVATLPRALRREERLIRRQIPVMGTFAEIAVRHPDEAWAQKAMDAAFAELRRVDAAMSRFRADSEVGQLNALAGKESLQVSEGTAEVLAAGLRWADASDGLFDPCLGRVCELWHVGTRTAPPSTAELAAAGRGCHFRELEVDRGRSVPRAALASGRAAVDLGGIAKGYGVDLAAQALRDHGIFHALVNAGGDLMAMGVDAEGDPWKVGVRSPDHLERMVEVLEVSDRAVATSGDYLQFFNFGGRRYHHILDAASGEPRITAMRSITVEAATCMDADAAATALYGVDAATARGVLERAAPGSRVVVAV
ncbi:MAG: FAD:protein FMN transferase [Gemmatimonadetes bacterium]|nr:FAD:protein FMN transferase [Gemmatimonadota bacterium]